MIKSIVDAVVRPVFPHAPLVCLTPAPQTIPVMAKVRIGHFVEAQVSSS